MKSKPEIKIPMTVHKNHSPRGADYTDNVIKASETTVHSCPFPSPDIMDRYTQVYPALPRTIIDSIVEEQRHRQNLEIIPFRIIKRGQLFTFIQ